MHDAAILQQLHYWTPRATGPSHDGHRWVYKTYDEWADEIGLTPKQVRQSIGRLEQTGVVLSCQPEKAQWRRRKWYRIDYAHGILTDPIETPSALEGRSTGPVGHYEQPDRADPIAPAGASITEITTEITTKTTSLVSATTSPDIPGSEGRDEATRLANLLADLIEFNGSRRPNVTDKWVLSIDRMMRIDGRTPTQVENAMKWAQKDEFWRANILSPDKLRSQYERLRLQAQTKGRAAMPRGLVGVQEFLDTLEEL